MKKHNFSRLFSVLAAPLLLVLLGLVLLLSPDTASALVGRFLAWGSLLAAVCTGAGALRGSAENRNNRLLWTAVFFFAGVHMLRKPLTIAKFLGRVLGITLMILGGRATADSIRYQGGKPVFSRSLVLGALTLIAGAVLAVLPMASSRILFKILGGALICFGAAKGRDALRGRKRLGDSDDPNIIDVEKL